MTTTYRTAGAWGAGKGANLTAAEVDTNFYGLEQRVGDLEGGIAGSGDNPMVDLTASGSTLTKFYADSTTATVVIAAPASAPITAVTSTTYTLNPSLSGYYHRCSNVAGCTVTVPSGFAFAAGGEWHFRLAPGCPFVAFVDDGTSDLFGVSGFANQIDSEGAVATVKFIGSDGFDLFGFLAPVSA